jgi:hypothetical protein
MLSRPDCHDVQRWKTFVGTVNRDVRGTQSGDFGFAPVKPRNGLYALDARLFCEKKTENKRRIDH